MVVHKGTILVFEEEGVGMVGLVGSGGEGVAASSLHYYFICGDGRSLFLDEGTSNACFPGSSLVKNINQWSHECTMSNVGLPDSNQKLPKKKSAKA